MISKNRIKQYFEEAILINQTIDSEFRRAIIKHERTSKFIDNMCNEIHHALKKTKIQISHKTIIDTVHSMTEWFIASIKMEAEQAHESVMAKIAREQEAQKIKDMDETLSGNPTGVYEEIIKSTKDESEVRD